MSEKTYNILVLCTGNSARSIMAEALFNVVGKGRFHAYSAGSRPTGKPNPFALELIGQLGYPTEAVRSKSWDEFAGPEAPKMDFVITVCDNAAGETCPVWPGTPVTAHWSFEDPAAVQGTAEEKRRAFKTTFNFIANRVRLFASLPLDDLDRLAVKREMNAIGQAGNV